MSALGARRLTARLPTRVPTGSAAVACAVLAALSLLIPSAPTTDPWGWIIWGHELIYGGFTTVMGGVPSWKPFPVLFTAPLSLAGDDAAPLLWLLLARAGGLYSLVVAWRLGNRLGGFPTGPLAAVGLVLSTSWVRALAHGYTEPLAIGLLLGAVDAHLSDHPRRALLLGTAVALTRPEAWPLLVLYAVLLVRRSRAHWALASALVGIVPGLWVVPEWITTGSPLHGGEVSRKVVPHGTGPAFDALGHALLITPIPLTVCALGAVGVSVGWRRRAVRGIAALAAAWTALLAVMVFADYPASERFFVLPAALVCLLGAVGAVGLVRSSRGRRLAPVLVALVAAGLIVRAVDAGRQGLDSVQRARLANDLTRAIDRAHPARLRNCRPLLPQGMSWVKGLVAYRLGVRPLVVKGVKTSAEHYVNALARKHGDPVPARPPPRIRVVLPHTRLVLFVPFDESRVVPTGTGRVRPLAYAGSWRVLGSVGVRSCGGRA
jgi:hypothetical protein